MIDDHSKANDDLKAVVGRKGATLPTGMGADNRTTFDRLSELRGGAFDAAYIRHMKEDHLAAIAEFRHEANYGHDPAIRRFAAKTLPVIREHYDLILRIDARRIRMGRM